jgi:hypothetical protein
MKFWFSKWIGRHDLLRKTNKHRESMCVYVYVCMCERERGRERERKRDTGSVFAS